MRLGVSSASTLLLVIKQNNAAQAPSKARVYFPQPNASKGLSQILYEWSGSVSTIPTLVLADLNTDSIRYPHYPSFGWPEGPKRTRVINLNAARATTVLGQEKVDLIVALGLFGDLRDETNEALGKKAWPAALCLILAL
jgi:hypothetical protein